MLRWALILFESSVALMESSPASMRGASTETSLLMTSEAICFSSFSKVALERVLVNFCLAAPRGLAAGRACFLEVFRDRAFGVPAATKAKSWKLAEEPPD